ncbi:MAG: superoxide dismutase [Fe] [Gammaproteobacteria bacterium]|nr:superoxide dismutase [Fe] [Gammaproteobacteria bacterium]MCF6229569.1 superoxide dismutase [Fe] [Gammaproteobacteria bacterium]
MSFELAPLPYAIDALAPHISAETLEYHYGKHHQAYVINLNNLLEESDFEEATLEEIMLNASGPLFNNAAQVWNHTFYWSCLSPQGGGEPTGRLAEAIKQQFGSFEAFKAQFSQACITHFGSGWVWLVENSQGELEIGSTGNADNPMTDKKIPLMTCDVWEHAYYIDYRNARPQYVEAFWSLVNWEYVAENFEP